MAYSADHAGSRQDMLQRGRARTDPCHLRKDMRRARCGAVAGKHGKLEKVGRSREFRQISEGLHSSRPSVDPCLITE